MKKVNHLFKEKAFKYFLFGNTLVIALLFGLILYSLVSESQISIQKFSFQFLYDEVWQPLISTDEKSAEEYLSLKTAIATDNSTSCYIAISPTNSSESIENIEFKLYSDYELSTFSSTNISRKGDVALETIILKDSLGNISDVTDLFDLKWDYMSQHSNTYFKLQLQANDTICALPAKSSIVAIFELEGFDATASHLSNSWSLKAHSEKLDGFSSKEISIIEESSFENLVDESIEDDSLITISLIDVNPQLKLALFLNDG